MAYIDPVEVSPDVYTVLFLRTTPSGFWI